jgi:hypothetical protein
MIDLNLSADIFTLAHTIAAEKFYLERKSVVLKSMPDEETSDWLMALRELERNTACDVISDMISSQEYEIALSKAYIPYLEEASLESVKAVFAWSFWQKSGSMVDGDSDRMKSDWFSACQQIMQIAEQPPSIPLDNSVKAYFRAIYNNRENREHLIAKKAYWRSMAHPHLSSLENFNVAEKYFEQVYYCIIEEHDSTIANNKAMRQVSLLTIENPEIANTIEFLAPRLRKIIEPDAH